MTLLTRKNIDHHSMGQPEIEMNEIVKERVEKEENKSPEG